MRMSQWLLAFVVLVSLGLFSCGPRYYFKPLVKPITGAVLVDGNPVKGVRVYARSTVPDNEHPTYPMAVTDDKGHFELYTYSPGDGVPVGEYKLTFTWNKGNTDRLGGRYSNPDKSPTPPFKIEKGPMDLGKIELTTK